MAVPEFFVEEEQVLVSSGNNDYNANQGSAHTAVVQETRKAFNNVPETLEEPQLSKLPFPCKEQVRHWENQLFHGDEVSADLNAQQYFSVLHVDCYSVKRPTSHHNKGVWCCWISSVAGPSAAAEATVTTKSTRAYGF